MPTTPVPTGGPEPSAAAATTSPARSQPGRQPSSAPWARWVSPRFSEIARTATTASSGRGAARHLAELDDVGGAGRGDEGEHGRLLGLEAQLPTRPR